MWDFGSTHSTRRTGEPFTGPTRIKMQRDLRIIPDNLQPLLSQSCDIGVVEVGDNQSASDNRKAAGKNGDGPQNESVRLVRPDDLPATIDLHHQRLEGQDEVAGFGFNDPAIQQNIDFKTGGDLLPKLVAFCIQA